MPTKIIYRNWGPDYPGPTPPIIIPDHTKLVEARHGEPERNNPDPIPWSVGFLVSAASSIQAAANMTNKSAAQQIIAAANQVITAFLDSDDICPRWPWPGPPPCLPIIASELTVYANTLQEGALRNGILQIAGQVLDRAQALAAGTAAAAGSATAG
jgi:hypothetical protein